MAQERVLEMRIRTIKPEFFKHEELYDAEMETGLPLRVAFAGLWCAADREGRFKWRPRALKSDILPFDNVDFSRVLHALATRGLVVRYASGTREFGWIPSFSKHQVINNREKPSELPKPTEASIQAASDACPTRAPRVREKLKYAQAEGNMEGNMEGKGKEGNTQEGESEGKPKNGKVGASTSRVSRFQKPTLDEWRQYCRELSPEWKSHDVESAYDHYEANGWIRGKTKVKDWRACARTCYRNWQKQNPQTRSQMEANPETGELEW
jgi:hypothetical protein